MNNQNPQLDSPDRRRFYAQLLQLLEFTRDMDRNKSDTTFAGSDGKIHYVFDENIFEYFVGARTQFGTDPVYHDRRKYSAMFHLEVWRDRMGDASKEGQWIRINRQIALIAGEYLLSGALPGQVDQKLYLTEWHSRELRRRFKVLLDHFGRKAKIRLAVDETDSLGKLDRIQRELETLLELAQESSTPMEKLINAAGLPTDEAAEIKQDLQKLQDSGSIDKQSALSFATARLVASKLIADDILEPLQQIGRIYSDEIAPRLFPLQLMRVRPGTDDRSGLGTAALDWHTRIAGEEDEREIPVALRRGAGRIAVDAASVAHVQWVADHLDPRKERIVLVTGDTLVFDAYRRWWTSAPERPFILRRVTQYAPILNFRDAWSKEISGAIFDNTRRALEPALMFFNLAGKAIKEDIDGREDSDTHVDHSRHQGTREYFALMLKQRHPVIDLFARNIDETIVRDHRQAYMELRDRWQELERLAIGLHQELLARRIENDQRNRLRKLRVEPNGIEKYINEKLLDELYRQNTLIFVPDVFRSLRKLLSNARRNVTNRAPIAMRLHLPLSEGRGDIAKLARELLETDPTNINKSMAALESGVWPAARPELLFAIAAVVALLMGTWDQAAQYADLAVASDSARKTKATLERGARSEYYELIYLRAIANRFKMGDLSGALVDGERRSRKLLDEAYRDLAECIEFHGDPSEERHILREMRALSERAALSLFYACWILRADDCKNADPVRTVGEIQSAHRDLCAAAALFKEGQRRVDTPQEPAASADYQRFFNQVKEQVTINTAAWYTIMHLVGERVGPSGLPERHDDPMFTRLMEDLNQNGVKSGPMGERSADAIADLSAFLWSFGRDPEARKVFSADDGSVDPLALRIDIDVMKIYRASFAAQPL